MRILILGISGFVGRRLARRLLESGDEVSGTYVGTPPEIPGAALREADVLAPDDLRQAVAASDPDLIFHLAALSHVGESWKRPGDYFQVNVLGTENLLRSIGGVPVVFTSSSEVYGQVPEDEQPIREDRPPAPANPYGLSKAAAERLMLAAGGLVVRLFSLVGPGQSPTFALPGFARQLAEIAAGKRPAVLQVGNLEARRDFLHVDDAVVALEWLGGRAAQGGVYNLATGRARSLRSLVEELVAISGLEVRLETDSARLRPVDVPLLVGDPARLEALGWEPRHSLTAALEQLWREAAGGVVAP